MDSCSLKVCAFLGYAYKEIPFQGDPNSSPMDTGLETNSDIAMDEVEESVHSIALSYA